MKRTKPVFLFLMLLFSAVAAYPQQDASGKFKKIKLVPDADNKKVDILVEGALFTSYIYPDVLKKPVLYPVKSSGGATITRGWPFEPRIGERTDHPHHVGLWFNYGDVNGYDFWNNSPDAARHHKGPFGTIRHRKIDKTVNGKDRGELFVSADWLKADSSVILREKSRFTFRATDDLRIIDRTVTLRALKDTVYFKDNKEGLFAIRVAKELEHPSTLADRYIDSSGLETKKAMVNNKGVTGHFISSEGKEGDAVWGTRAKWVALSGKIKDEKITLLILDHKRNPGYPAYWHARGYGLFGANSLGQAAMSGGKETLNFVLLPGESVTFSYRLLIFTGKELSKEEINRLHLDFIRQ